MAVLVTAIHAVPSQPDIRSCGSLLAHPNRNIRLVTKAGEIHRNSP